MRVYTVLTNRDPGALQQFAQTCVDCGVTGVTIFTVPAMVTSQPVPGEITPEQVLAQADAAAARKDYVQAANPQSQAAQISAQRQERTKTAAAWIKDALPESLQSVTQLVVLGSTHWQPDLEFTATNFLANLSKVSIPLLSTGIGGIVQKTPLASRTFIPLAPSPGAQSVSGGGTPQAVSSPPAAPRGSGVVPPPRHDVVPANLSEKQAQYAGYRLGLDRGGARRSKQEAGNLMGFSPSIGGKMEAEISRVWPAFSSRINENVAEVMP